MRVTLFFVMFFISFVLHAQEFVGTGTKIQHPPYATKKCFNCHKKDADGNPIKNQFVANQPDLCYKCHDRVDDKTNVHPALKGKCTACHSPHESVNVSLLKKKISDTCVNCHDAPGMDAANKHSAIIMTKSCVRCHEPHSSQLKKLLKEKTQKLCIYCHTDMGKELINPDNTIHPAVNMGCQKCHEPHGSENGKLLKANLNDLCFNCHDKSNFADGHPRPGHPTSGKPDPLQSDRELTCISCHKPHFSKNEHLLRYNFKVAPYDGTICSTCHWSKFMPPPGPPKPPWND